MKKEHLNEIEIPKEVEIKLDGNTINVKGKVGELEKTFNFLGVKLEIKDKKIVIGCKKATKKEKKMINTITAHLQNIIKGVQEKFEYKLKICYSHFPMTVEVKGDGAIIKNFLGEKIPRKIKILKGVEINVSGQEITLSGIDKELVGQTAANFEKATRIPLKDRRVFQDGIFIINKAGKEI